MEIFVVFRYHTLLQGVTDSEPEIRIRFNIKFWLEKEKEGIYLFIVS